MTFRDIADPPAIGWRFIAWTGEAHPCNVRACGRSIHSGHVRVDNCDPMARGFVVVCSDCWFKIQLGIDPDPDATIPQWEVDRRAAATDPDS